MKAENDALTIQALRADVARQISRFLAGQQLTQATAAQRLRVPQPTLSKVMNGRVADLSLELLIRIAVRAGLLLVLQTGRVPEEAGAFVSGGLPDTRQGPRSKLADEARDELLAAARNMTPEQRLLAHVKHSELLAKLHRAGERGR